MRGLLLAVSLGLLTAAGPTQLGGAKAATAEVAAGVEPFTIEIHLENGATQAIRLIGLAAAPQPDACGVQHLRARSQELLNETAVTVEMSPELMESETDSRIPASVWLSDGRNLAEILLREGSVLAAFSEQHSRSRDFVAAEAAAAQDQVGIWAPGACRTIDGDPTSAGARERSDLSAVLTAAGFAVQQARTATDVLREQARSAPQVASTSNWQNTTRTALASARQGASILQAQPSRSGYAAQILAADLAASGRDIDVQMDAFAGDVAAGEIAGLQTKAGSLAQMSDRLSVAAARMSGLAAAYGVGD
jgi:endonuclease YncB( thermonuclease family)